MNKKIVEPYADNKADNLKGHMDLLSDVDVLTDAVIESWGFYIPYIYGQAGWKVEGTAGIDMIYINSEISIDEKEIKLDFIRASGPGGQNVNKVASAVQLRFDVEGSASLPDKVRARLITLAGRRITEDGILIIKAERFRTQFLNRQDAINRLTGLIREALKEPKIRKKTKPSASSKRRMLDGKRHRSNLKRLRRPAQTTDD